MREVIHPQLGLGELPIGEIKLDLKSRDDIPKLLIGLQHIYVTPALREAVFAILREVIPERAGRGKASVALAVLARNLQRLGIMIRQRQGRPPSRIAKPRTRAA